MRFICGILLIIISTLSFAEETEQTEEVEQSWSVLENRPADNGHYFSMGVIEGDQAAILKLEVDFRSMLGYWLIVFSDIGPDTVVKMLYIQLEYADGTTLSLKPQLESYVNENYVNKIGSNESENHQYIMHAIDIEQVKEIMRASYITYFFQRKSDVENRIYSTHRFTLKGSSASINEIINATTAANVNTDTRPNVDITEESVAANKAAQAEAEAKKKRIAEEQRKKREAARQARIAEEKAQAERERLAAEKAKREAREKKEKYRKAMNNFDWPSGCGSPPSIPGTNASNYTIDRFNSRYGNWADCQNDMIDEDVDAIRDLVLKVDGSWKWTSSDNSSWSWSVPKACECFEGIQKLHQFKDERADRRNDRIDRMNDAIEDVNDAVDRQEMWNDIYRSVDDTFREMERQQQQMWDNMYNQPYITPGYN